MKKPRECLICGCTEDNPCMTSKGPCSWAFETRAGSVCSACIVELPPDPTRNQYPDAHLLIEKYCLNCASLIEGALWKGSKTFTCSKGRFDGEAKPTYFRAEGYHHWFAWSGIKRPNKTVSKARRRCVEWELHPRWQPKVSV